MDFTVIHQSIELNWLMPQQISNPKTLVLGSFNPYNNETNAVDFYYGRNSNYFWKVIARINNEDESFFLNSIDRKKNIMNERFCCLDVIDSIVLSSKDEGLLNDYLNKNIFSNYLDQKIWASYTNYHNNRIFLARKYNERILDFLINTKSIRKVIHTMGKNRINEAYTSPRERNLKDAGFGGFIKNILKICQEKNIEFVFESYSPSEYAVKTGKVTKDNLERFFKENLWFND